MCACVVDKHFGHDTSEWLIMSSPAPTPALLWLASFRLSDFRVTRFVANRAPMATALAKYLTRTASVITHTHTPPPQCAMCDAHVLAAAHPRPTTHHSILERHSLLPCPCPLPASCCSIRRRHYPHCAVWAVSFHAMSDCHCRPASVPHCCAV